MYMMLARLFLVTGALLIAGYAQTAAPTLTITGPATVQSGGTFTASLTLSGSGNGTAAAPLTTGSGLTGIEWVFSPPTGALLAATGATGNGVQCFNVTCLVADDIGGAINANLLTDGLISTIPVTVAATAPLGPMSITFFSMTGVNNVGSAVTMAWGAPLSITVTSSNHCDANNDGVVNALDVQAVINGVIGKSACPVGFTSGCTLLTTQAVLNAALFTANPAQGKACTL